MVGKVEHRVLTGITRIPTAANDNGKPPAPGAPAVFMQRWTRPYKRTCARTPSMPSPTLPNAA